MARASPARTSFNAGEFSPLLEGRTDLDRYPASMRALRNFVAAPQGPAVRRSGTRFVVPTADDAEFSGFVNFEFNETQLYLLEFCAGRMRVLTEEGLITHAPQALSILTTGVNFNVQSAGLNALVGEQVALSGLDLRSNLNGTVARVLAKVGDVYQLEAFYPVGVPTTAGQGSRVFSVAAPYTGEACRRVYGLQDDDTVRLYCDGYRKFKVSRFGLLDWRITEVITENGPFAPVVTDDSTLTFNGTGNPIPPQFAEIAANGTAFGDGEPGAGGNPAWYMFDGTSRSWISEFAQRANMGYIFTTARRITGYSFASAKGLDIVEANENGWTALDYAPSTWVFEASADGVTYVTLDAKQDYVLYDNGRSTHFKVNNPNTYRWYRFRVTSSVRGSGTKIAIAELTFTEENAPPIGMTISAGAELNGNGLFRPTDVGRLFRVKSKDNNWRVVRAVAYTSPTVLQVALEAEPLGDTAPTSEWQAGYFCDTVGWPTTAVFFEDRLYEAGLLGAPNLVVGSVVGDYDNFEQRTPGNEVLDDSALVLSLKARKQSRIRWMETDERGLLVGTGTNEWVISSTGEGVITARAVRNRASTARGSADVAPVKVDRQVLFVQRSKRTIREFAYVFDADGYKTPSMSLFASHIGVKLFEQMAFSSEPYSIVWVRRNDGSVAGLTYNREENVIGWHVHDFGGTVEAIATLPSSDGLQDALWLVVRRTVNGVQRRYIEVMERFWDFDSVIEQAHFVDSGLRYSGAPATVFYGAGHLEGRDVVGLADGVPFEATILNGSFTIRNPASDVVYGLPYESYGEISRIEAGATEGTSQGKTKRVNELKMSLWETAMGEIALSVREQAEWEYNDIIYRERFDNLEPVALFTGITPSQVVPKGYDVDCTIRFRQQAPLPFNLVALLPQLVTNE